MLPTREQICSHSGTHQERMVQALFKKINFPLRIQFLVIALSLTITTTVLGLSAYLTDTDAMHSSFHIATGDDLGFSLTGNKYNDYPISLGETVDLDAKAEISGRYELYVFVEIDPSADFTLNGFDSAVWKPITDDSNAYYYGSTGALVPLGGENGKSVGIIKSFTLSATTTNTDNFFRSSLFSTKLDGFLLVFFLIIAINTSYLK